MIEPTNTLTFRALATIELAGAEISAYDSGSGRVFTTSGSGLQIIDLSSPANPTLTDTIPFTGAGDITSVATFNGLVAVAAMAANRTDAGTVYLLDSDGNILNEIPVGSLPDMIAFSPDGSKILVANEGEATLTEDVGPGADFVNPVGSISVIDLSEGVDSASVQTLGFEAFNSEAEALIAEGVRLFVNSPGFEGTTVAQDLEPEYIAIAPDGQTAWVTLQEANSVAVIDLSAATPVVTDIISLGLKDWSGLNFDPSDKDDGINFANDLPIFGMYMPDAIASYEVGGETYFVMANEGDDRDDFTSETDRLGALDLDDALFPDETDLQTIIGRLNSPALDGVNGDTDGDGDIDQILTYGARSITIRDGSGNIVFDSGDMIDTFVADHFPELFDDGRSDNKGSEPEGVTIGHFDGRTYAFVALERFNSTMVFDITDPAAPVIATFLANAGDVSPESGLFVSASDSATGEPLFLVSNEVSQTLTVYELLAPKLVGGNGKDSLVGTISDDLMAGRNGNDLLEGNFGDDDVVGGNGKDQLSGGLGNDTVRGGNGQDALISGAGDDVLLGGNGHDELDGGLGNDTVRGGNQKDALIGGAGDDTLAGGRAKDLFIFDNAVDTGHDLIEDMEHIDQILLTVQLEASDLELANGVLTFASGGSIEIEGVETLSYEGTVDYSGTLYFVYEAAQLP